jgi:hypothetical protein
MGHTRIAVLTCVAVGGCADSASTITATNEQDITAGGAQVPETFLRDAKRLEFRPGAHTAALAGAPRQARSAIDTLVNFSGQFTAPGFDSDGNPQSVWRYTMVGRDPAQNRTTTFAAPIIPVIVELLDADGHVGKTASGAPLRMVSGPDTVALTLNSPVYQKFPYTSGTTQLADGMMRAQFWSRFGDHHGDGDGDHDHDRDDQGYHTLLEPSVKPTRTIQLPFGSYRFGPKPDGTCCRFVVADVDEFSRHLFPATPDDTTTVMGAAEHAGDIKPSDITTLLFRDVYLSHGDPATCCILGFHSVDVEPGNAANGHRERDYVMNYASYISDGLFGGGFVDVTVISHEMTELFADPFIDNATPWWLSLDRFTGFNLCQNNLEGADVVEVRSQNVTHAVPMHGRTYHPQNTALLPWFAFESPSSAHLGAYSFPDETTLPALSPTQLLSGCVPAR